MKIGIQFDDKFCETDGTIQEAVDILTEEYKSHDVSMIDILNTAHPVGYSFEQALTIYANCKHSIDEDCMFIDYGDGELHELWEC